MMTVVVRADAERDLIVETLTSLGVPDEEAAIQARFLVEADLRGHASHGLQRLPVIAERIRNGLAVPGAGISVEWNGKAMTLVDGRRGLGPVVGTRVAEQAAARAQALGTASIGVHNSNHLGILAPYVEKLARSGLVGLVLTTSEALVHPWGGRTAMLGTNPVAIGVPAEPQPFVLDMATGAISIGKVLAYREEGRKLEIGWAVDRNGQPTDDPDEALQGALSPAGGPKGYALGIALELVVSLLTDTALGRDVTGTLDPRTVCNKGDLFTCFDPRSLGFDAYAGPLSSFLASVRASTPASGGSVRVPGDRARSERARRLRQGIELPGRVWARAGALRAGEG